MTKQFDMSFQGEKKMSKCSCSPLALRNVCSFRMNSTRNFSAPFPHFLLWPKEPFALRPIFVCGLWVYYPEIHQVFALGGQHRIVSGAQRFLQEYRDAQAPGETKDQLTVMGTKWGSAWLRYLFSGP